MRNIKIGAHISVRNEINWIGRVLRYHLECQNFHVIIINDDGSYDGTREVIEAYSKKDNRVIPVYTQQKKGFTQSEFSLNAINVLFNKFGCDYAFPIDADEFWHSEECNSIHDVLKSISPKKSMLITYAYDFQVTEKDNHNEPDVTKKQFYCKVNSNPKAVFCRTYGCISSIEIGNHAHTVVFNTNDNIPVFKVPITMLCRFHYRIGDKLSFMRKVLNQVEGYTVATQGKWLHTPKQYGSPHIWNHYMRIRNHGLDKEYQRISIPNTKVQKLIDSKKLFYKKCMQDKVPDNPDFVKKIIDRNCQ